MSDSLHTAYTDESPALAEDGKTWNAQRWSTPVRGYRQFGTYQLFATGEARYAPPSGFVRVQPRPSRPAMVNTANPTNGTA